MIGQWRRIVQRAGAREFSPRVRALCAGARVADGGEELYDHKTDPHEWRNLAGDPSLAKVKSRLAKHLPTVNAEPISIKRKK